MLLLMLCLQSTALGRNNPESPLPHSVEYEERKLQGGDDTARALDALIAETATEADNRD